MVNFFNIVVILFLIAIIVLLIFMFRGILYLKKGNCVNVPEFTGDGYIYEKDISIPIIGKKAGATLTFKKDGTFVVVGRYGGNSVTYTNNKWVYLKETCILGVNLDPLLLAEIKKAPIAIDISDRLQYNEHKELTIKCTISDLIVLDLVVSLKK